MCSPALGGGEGLSWPLQLRGVCQGLHRWLGTAGARKLLRPKKTAQVAKSGQSSPTSSQGEVELSYFGPWKHGLRQPAKELALSARTVPGVPVGQHSARQ